MIPFIFCHIPRTGGTSMYSILKLWTVEFYLPSKATILPYEKENLFINHNNPVEIIKKLPSEFKNHLLCGFIRDPRSRLVSLYYHLKLDKKMHFNTFVDRVITQPLGKVGLYKNKNLSVCNPQVKWGLKHFDFIGKFENLERDWSNFCTMVGILYRPIPHLNKKESEINWKNYYNYPGLLDRVNTFYKEDLCIGNYKKYI